MEHEQKNNSTACPGFLDSSEKWQLCMNSQGVLDSRPRHRLTQPRDGCLEDRSQDSARPPCQKYRCPAASMCPGHTERPICVFQGTGTPVPCWDFPAKKREEGGRNLMRYLTWESRRRDPGGQAVWRNSKISGISPVLAQFSHTSAYVLSQAGSKWAFSAESFFSGAFTGKPLSVQEEVVAALCSLSLPRLAGVRICLLRYAS